jgi:hypothetical protein
MARAGEQYVFGIEEAFKVLDGIGLSFSGNSEIITSAAKKALIPVKQQAKLNLRSIGAARKSRNNAGFSKLAYIARSIAVRPLVNRKGSLPGARVKAHGPDIPVGQKLWNIEGYAKLLSAGQYLSKGKFKGFGNYVKDAGQSREQQVRQLFVQNMKPQMDRVVAKTIRRHGRKHGK